VRRDITVIAFLLVLQKILPLLIFLNILLVGGVSFFMKIGVIIPIFLFCFYSLSNFNKIYSLFFISRIYHVGLIFLIMGWGGREKLAIWYFFIYSFFFFICAWACSRSQYENKIQNFAYGKSSLFFIFMGIRGLPPFLIFSLKILLLVRIG
jgi:hypothetical protein